RGAPRGVISRNESAECRSRRTFLHETINRNISEDLQGIAVRFAKPGGAFDPDIFTQWLGPKTNEAWQALLKGFKGNPPDLKTVVQAVSQGRDLRAMTQPESLALKRSRRHQQRKQRPRK
ncbi:hypothetical protein, partial [Deinococcus alpinitundrae]|uniref:hypothetical protein n=1 Tax=Deinococcus alpinitundrae TaxID=468913 RepID=UPI001ED9434D